MTNHYYMSSDCFIDPFIFCEQSIWGKGIQVDIFERDTSWYYIPRMSPDGRLCSVGINTKVPKGTTDVIIHINQVPGMEYMEPMPNNHFSILPKRILPNGETIVQVADDDTDEACQWANYTAPDDPFSFALHGFSFNAETKTWDVSEEIYASYTGFTTIGNIRDTSFMQCVFKLDPTKKTERVFGIMYWKCNPIPYDAALLRFRVGVGPWTGPGNKPVKYVNNGSVSNSGMRWPPTTAPSKSWKTRGINCSCNSTKASGVRS